MSLDRSGAQCLAVDPADGDTLYVGLRDGGVRRSSDGGQTWVDCRLPSPQVFSVAVSPADGTVYAEPSRARSIEATTVARAGASSRACSSSPRGRPGASRAAAVDVPCSLGRSEPARCQRRARRNRARRAYALDRRRETWQDQRPGVTAGRPPLAWHPRGRGARVRSRRRRGGGSEDGGDSWCAGRRGPRPPLRRGRWRWILRIPSSARVREHWAVCSARDARRRPAGASTTGREARAGIGSRAVFPTRGCLRDAVCARRYGQSGLAGLANGELWASPRSRGTAGCSVSSTNCPG